MEIAATHPIDFVKVLGWMKVLSVAGFEDDPIASIDAGYGVFEFETDRLCVLSIWPKDEEPILTQIFVRNGPHAIAGRRNRAIAAAQAIGVTPFIIL